MPMRLCHSISTSRINKTIHSFEFFRQKKISLFFEIRNQKKNWECAYKKRERTERFNSYHYRFPQQIDYHRSADHFLLHHHQNSIVGDYFLLLSLLPHPTKEQKKMTTNKESVGCLSLPEDFRSHQHQSTNRILNARNIRNDLVYPEL